jgi:hypothetical protein
MIKMPRILLGEMKWFNMKMNNDDTLTEYAFFFFFLI